MCLADGIPELHGDFVIIPRLTASKPLQHVEDIILYRGHREGAGLFARCFTTYSIGHHQEITLIAAMTGAGLWKTRLPNSQRLIEYRDKKLIFILGPASPNIAESKTFG
jgi:hypothetical protein